MSLESDKKYFDRKLENQINVLLFFEKFNSSPVPLSYFKIFLVPKKKMAMLSWSPNPLEDRPDIFQYTIFLMIIRINNLVYINSNPVLSSAEADQHEYVRQAAKRKRRGFSRIDMTSSVYYTASRKVCNNFIIIFYS